MSQAANGCRTDATPRQDLPAVRSAGCVCDAQPGSPCTENGDHLERYLRAAKQGTIDRQTLKEVVSGLDVIAPRAVVPVSKDADQVVRGLGFVALAWEPEAGA